MAVAAAFWGAIPVLVAGFSPNQAVPEAGSPPALTTPSPEITLEQRGDIFMARKNYADAADYYYRALKQASLKNAKVWNKLGIALQQQSKFSNARKAYSNATREDKNFAEAWNNLGTVYFTVATGSKSSKNLEKSIKCYRRAIELTGDAAAFHLNLGTSYYHLKMYSQAVEEYRTALGIDPNVATQESSVGTVVHPSGEDVEYFFYMAKALASVGNAEDATRYLRRAIEDGLSDPQRIADDPDFQKISQYPAFVELMKNPPVSIKN
jgi:tetratricopeptide (TPR) repeat protein